MTSAREVTLNRQNPWPGLAAFQENARNYFHGRGSEAERLLRSVLDAPITVLMGRSGLGKTSLLRAGLFPLLRDSHFLPVYVHFELGSGAAPLSHQLHRSVRDAIRVEVPDATLPSAQESVWEYLHRANLELWSKQSKLLTPVIVLDEFEDLFPPGKRVPDLARAFMYDLGDLAENRIPAELAARIDDDDAVARQFDLSSHNYKLLICLREDFLPDLEEWRRLIPALGRSRMRLYPLSAHSALDAVYKPAAHLMTDALARRMVDILAQKNHDRGRHAAWADGNRPEDDPGGVDPALLSLFCRELNEERKRRKLPQFDAQLVEDNQDDILSNYYLSCVRDLMPSVAEFVESELITGNGFRKRYARDDAVPSRLTERDLDELIRSRLIQIVDHDGTKWIELTHDVITPVVREHRERRAEARLRDETSRRLVSEAQQMLDGTHPGGTVRAYQQLLAARQLAETDDDRPLLDSLFKTVNLIKVADAGSQVLSTAFSPDGTRLATGGADATVRLWDADTAQPVGDPLTGHTDRVWSVAFSPDGRTLASGSADRTAQLWDAATGHPVGDPLTGHTSDVTSVAFSPDGKRLATSSADYTVRLWDAATGQAVGDPLTGHTSTVSSVAFSPDGKRLATGSVDKTVRLWDPATAQPVAAPLTGHTDRVWSVAFSPDGKRLATGSVDKTVRLWDADTGQPIGNTTEPGHTDAVYAVAFSPDGARLATSSYDKTVRLWDADTGQPVAAPLTGHTRTVSSVAFSPDGKRLATGSHDATVRLWDAATGHTDTVSNVAFSPDGKRLATSSYDKTVRLWDADTGQPVGDPLTGHTDAVYAVAFSPDGKRLATAGNDNSVRLWDAATGQPVGDPLTGHTDAVYAVAFSPDGARLATGSYDNSVRLWHTATGQPVGDPLTGHTDAVYAVAFSPDGARLATGSYDETVRLWHTATGQPVGDPLTGHTGRVSSVAFSPDGKRLATGSDDETVRLWHTATGQPVGDPLTGHTGRVSSVAFSPDGKRLATGSDDRTVRLWHTATGQPVGDPLTGHPDAVTSVAFSPDSARIRIASGCADQKVRLWSRSDDAMLAMGAKLTTNMSHQQWNDWVSPDIDYITICPDLPFAR